MSSVHTQSILVVEDEPLILMDTIDMVEDEGFRVFEATNAVQALAVLEEQTDIDVLFTDIHMPGAIDGLGLAQLVRKRWPHIAIVVVSGRHMPEASALPENGQFITKPYRRAGLLKALRQALFI